jgi:hypothetical protein
VLAVANTGQVSLLPWSTNSKAQPSKLPKSLRCRRQTFRHRLAAHHRDAGTTDAPILHDLSLDASRLAAAPSVPAHAVTAPRIAFMHTWLGTQTEGWWRYAFDTAGVPYDYINTQTVAGVRPARKIRRHRLRSRRPRVRARNLNGIPCGTIPCRGRNPTSRPTSAHRQHADIRPGLGYDGLAHLKTFVEQGGLLITCEDTAQFAIDTGLAPGVSVAPQGDARVVGTVLNTVFVNHDSPVAFGYGAGVPVISAGGMAFNVSNTLGRTGGRVLMDPYAERNAHRPRQRRRQRRAQGRKSPSPSRW